MKKERIVELLGEELAELVIDKMGGVEKFVIGEATEFVPKGVYNEANALAQNLQKQIGERDSQLANLAKQVKGNEELTQELARLQAENQQAAANLAATKRSFAIETALREAGVRNPRAASALLNDEAITLSAEGKLLGLSEQLNSLRESDDYLFFPKDQATQQPTPPIRTGGEISPPNGQRELSGVERAFKRLNPDIKID